MVISVYFSELSEDDDAAAEVETRPISVMMRGDCIEVGGSPD